MFYTISVSYVGHGGGVRNFVNRTMPMRADANFTMQFDERQNMGELLLKPLVTTTFLNTHLDSSPNRRSRCARNYGRHLYEEKGT